MCIFGHFGPNIAIFCTFCPMPNQKPMWTRCLGGFSVMWVTKLLIFPVEIRIFCPKTTKFGPKFAFLVNLGQAMQAYSVPCWWAVWWLWRVGWISQDTYLLYDKIQRSLQSKIFAKRNSIHMKFPWCCSKWHERSPTNQSSNGPK